MSRGELQVLLRTYAAYLHVADTLAYLPSFLLELLPNGNRTHNDFQNRCIVVLIALVKRVRVLENVLEEKHWWSFWMVASCRWIREKYAHIFGKKAIQRSHMFLLLAQASLLTWATWAASKPGASKPLIEPADKTWNWVVRIVSAVISFVTSTIATIPPLLFGETIRTTYSLPHSNVT
jgi:hypothetical protein